MNRKQILDARIKVEAQTPMQKDRQQWTFYATKNVSHGGGPVTARKFSLYYDSEDRTFNAFAVRRVSKRRKRVNVSVSAGMIAYLRSRLTPADIAACTLASLAPRNDWSGFDDVVIGQAQGGRVSVTLVMSKPFHPPTKVRP